ncbi:MAG: TIGR03084 family metal-binding protein, partial [Pseudomonadota bacterium]
LAPLSDADFERPTQFKQWTVNDVITHLHVWNQAADLSLHDTEALASFLGKVRIAMASGDLREAERAFTAGLKGTALREQWRDGCRATAQRFSAADPKARVKWAGPSMSVRSSITARLMETWAHGQALYDLLGIEREDAERIRNIVVLGVNTFEWTFKNRGEKAPGDVPRLALAAPSGELWEWHTENTSDSITGLATEFCQVVTQVRNVADTALEVKGDVAIAWMANAQCFAGPPHPPPKPGTRFLQKH